MAACNRAFIISRPRQTKDYFDHAPIRVEAEPLPRAYERQINFLSSTNPKYCQIPGEFKPWVYMRLEDRCLTFG